MHTQPNFFELWVLLHSEVAKKLELPTAYVSTADAARSGRAGARFREGERESDVNIPETDCPLVSGEKQVSGSDRAFFTAQSHLFCFFFAVAFFCNPRCHVTAGPRPIGAGGS